MAIFTEMNELEQYLRGLNANYNQYAKDLWTNGVTSTSQLGNASAATLIACGVRSPLHAEDIIAQSKAPGKSSLAYGDHFISCDMQQLSAVTFAVYT